LVESNIADVKIIRDIQLSGTASIRAVVEVTDEATAFSIASASSEGLCVSLDDMAYCTDGTSFELDGHDNTENGALETGADSDSDVTGQGSSSGSMSTGAIAGLALLVVLVAVLVAIVAVQRSQKDRQHQTGGTALSYATSGADSDTMTQTSAYMGYLKSMSKGMPGAALVASDTASEQHVPADYEQPTSGSNYEQALAGADAGSQYEMATMDRPSYDMGAGTAAADGYDQANHEDNYDDDAASQVAGEELPYDPMTTEEDAQSLASNPGFASSSSSPPSIHEEEDPAILDQQRALTNSNQGSIRSELYTANVPTIPPTPPPMPGSEAAEVTSITSNMSMGASEAGMRLRTPSPMLERM
jgi:hypothetical protein